MWLSHPTWDVSVYLVVADVLLPSCLAWRSTLQYETSSPVRPYYFVSGTGSADQCRVFTVKTLFCSCTNSITDIHVYRYPPFYPFSSFIIIHQFINEERSVATRGSRRTFGGLVPILHVKRKHHNAIFY